MRRDTMQLSPLPSSRSRKDRSGMKIFLDTANLDEIKEGAALGLVDGVTTNPTLVSKENGDYNDMLTQICDIVRGPVSAEVVADEAEEMCRQGHVFAKLSEYIVVKIPMTPEGMKAVKKLTAEEI